MTQQKPSIMSEQVIANLLGTVGGLEQAVQSLVQNAREDRNDAKEYRQGIQKQLEAVRVEQYATRMEQLQLVQTLTGLSERIGGLTNTLNKLDDERKERTAIVGFVSKSAKVAWTLFGAAVTAAGAAIWKGWGGHPPSPGGGP